MEMTEFTFDGSVGQKATGLVLENIKSHGNIVGVIHTINGFGEQTTKFFHENGYVETVSDFEAGENAELDKIVGLKMSLCLIPGVAPYIEGEYLRNFITYDRETSKEDEINHHYLFRVPAEAPPKLHSCKGIKVFEEAISCLSERQDCEIIEGEW